MTPKVIHNNLRIETFSLELDVAQNARCCWHVYTFTNANSCVLQSLRDFPEKPNPSFRSFQALPGMHCAEAPASLILVPRLSLERPELRLLPHSSSFQAQPGMHCAEAPASLILVPRLSLECTALRLLPHSSSFQAQPGMHCAEGSCPTHPRSRLCLECTALRLLPHLGLLLSPTIPLHCPSHLFFARKARTEPWMKSCVYRDRWARRIDGDRLRYRP